MASPYAAFPAWSRGADWDEDDGIPIRDGGGREDEEEREFWVSTENNPTEKPRVEMFLLRRNSNLYVDRWVVCE